MKAIDEIEKKRFRSGMIGAILFVFGIPIIFYTKSFDTIWVLLVIFILLEKLFPLKCPFCNKQIMNPTGTKKLKYHGVNYCHNCGEEFNQEIVKTEQTDSPNTP